MDEYSETYDQYVKITYRLHFFNSCKSKKIIPTGLTIEQNLATHVNDEDFISECKKVLSEASSRGLDLVIERFEKTKIHLEGKMQNIFEHSNISREQKFIIIGNTMNKNNFLKVNLANKLTIRVQQVEETKSSPFRLSGGSRKVCGDEYIPVKNCQCCPKRIRPHRLGRRNRKKVVKYVPKAETLKDIIADEKAKRDPINLTDFVITDDMKEVLLLGATFAPTPTRPIDLYSLYVDFNKWAEDGRLGSLATLDPLQGCNKRDDAAARAWGT